MARTISIWILPEPDTDISIKDRYLLGIGYYPEIWCFWLSSDSVGTSTWSDGSVGIGLWTDVDSIGTPSWS